MVVHNMFNHKEFHEMICYFCHQASGKYFAIEKQSEIKLNCPNNYLVLCEFRARFRRTRVSSDECGDKMNESMGCVWALYQWALSSDTVPPDGKWNQFEMHATSQPSAGFWVRNVWNEYWQIFLPAIFRSAAGVNKSLSFATERLFFVLVEFDANMRANAGLGDEERFG